MPIIVDIGEFVVSDAIGETIKTFALGSCLGVFVFCRKTKLTGLLHLQLPESSINPELAKQKPGIFADTGINALLKEMRNRGWKSPHDLIVKLAGGSYVLDASRVFDIGKRNYLAAKKILWANNLWPNAEEVGGEISRTLTAIVGEPKLYITSPDEKERWI